MLSRIPRSHGRLAVRPRKHAAFASPHAFGVRLRATHSPQEMAESMPPKTRRRSTMTKSAASAPEDKLKLYEKLVATNPKVERKGATMPYTSLNGHMFSYL